ncbi:transposase, partial [Parapedobacter sp. 2B3]|uniref:transposase n=1 Tax=Parapedobacter sp. 2B3 TaxID=3342381 RepID=UPI0035B5D5E2
RIPVSAFRGDSASYQKEVLELMDSRNVRFYIRMLDFRGIRETFAGLDDWQTIRVNEHRKEVGSVCYSFKDSQEKYRVVVTRTLKKSNQLDAFENRSYHYQAIITNDGNSSEKEVIEFYNQRGDAEKSNCYLLNDFNLSRLPFMDMDTNTTYMYLMAMCATLFEWIKQVLVTNKTPGISLTMRAKAICFQYITVSARWITHARKTAITVFSRQQYRPLLI